MDDRSELATFVRSRRERLLPTDVDLGEPASPSAPARRRTSGLRREEVAVLAGLSVTHYTRIEQGRGARPSAQVLDALARALRLSEDERAYLFQVGRHAPTRSRRRRRPGVPAPVLRMLDLLETVPAMVLDPRMDVLAWNPMAAALLVDFAELLPAQRNMVRLTFLHPELRDRFTDHDAVAREAVSALRAALPALDGDERLALLIGELTLASEDFRKHWNRLEVRQKGRGRKGFRHPVAGRLDLDYEAMRLQDDLILVVYTAPAGSPDDTALRLLHRSSGREPSSTARW